MGIFNNLFSKSSNIENESVEQIEEERDYIDTLEYNPKTKRILLIVKRETKKPKITRYVQKDYVRTAIYGEYSIRTKEIRKVNKEVNINKFLEEIDKLDLGRELDKEICDRLNIIPLWYQKIIDIDELKKEIILKMENIDVLNKEIDSIISNHNNEISQYKNKKAEIKNEYSFKENKYNKSLSLHTFPDSKGKLFLYILLIPVALLGLFLLPTYVSKNKAIRNRNTQIILEDELTEYTTYLDSSFITIDKSIFNIEKNINLDKSNYDKKIEIEKKNIVEIENQISNLNEQDYKSVYLEEDDGYLNLRKSLEHKFEGVKKGCYIIRNKTKNKYYVGQSKDIFNRVFSQHFNKGDVKNLRFAKDWWANDEFLWKYVECETKDELDSLENSLISKYDAFTEGYNKTGGNK